MEKPESNQYRQELADELKILRTQRAPEAALVILKDQQGTPEYNDAKDVHQVDRQELFSTRANLENKRKEIEVLKRKLNELEGGILSEDQVCGLEIMRKKYEYLMYTIYVNESDTSQDILAKIPIEVHTLYAPHTSPHQQEVDKKQKPVIANPAKQDFGRLSTELKKDNNGKYTLNPEAQEVDFDMLPIERIEFRKIENTHSIHEALTETAKEYSDNYILPGIELANYLMEVDADGRFVNKELIHRLVEDLSKDIVFCFLPGSIVSINSSWTAISISRGENGDWNHIGTQLLTSPYLPEKSVMFLIKK